MCIYRNSFGVHAIIYSKEIYVRVRYAVRPLLSAVVGRTKTVDNRGPTNMKVKTNSKKLEFKSETLSNHAPPNINSP